MQQYSIPLWARSADSTSRFSPYLPFTCQTLHGYLGNEGPLQAAGWKFQPPPAGRPLADAQPLFKKLDPAIVAEEEQRLGS